MLFLHEMVGVDDRTYQLYIRKIRPEPGANCA